MHWSVFRVGPCFAIGLTVFVPLGPHLTVHAVHMILLDLTRYGICRKFLSVVTMVTMVTILPPQLQGVARETACRNAVATARSLIRLAIQFTYWICYRPSNLSYWVCYWPSNFSYPFFNLNTIFAYHHTYLLLTYAYSHLLLISAYCTCPFCMPRPLYD